MRQVPLEPKKISEDIYVFFNFFDQMEWGETIGTPVVTVDNFSGTDYNPSAILSGAAVVVEGTQVRQRIIDGMPGCLYLLTATVIGSSGTTYKVTEDLSILSDVDNFVPSSTPTLTGTLPDGIVGAPYSSVLNITGGYAPYSPVGIIANAPPWMGFSTVDNTLVCAGIPDVVTTYNFSPAILDAAFTPANSPQSIDITRITVAGSAPDSVVGNAVDFFYTASLGTPPYTFPTTPAGFPPGWVLSSDGHVTGTSAAEGNFSWEVMGVDANGVTDLHPDNANVTISVMLTAVSDVSYLQKSVNAGVSWPTTVETGGDAVTEDALVFAIAGGMAERHTPIKGRYSLDGAIWNNCTVPGGTGFPLWILRNSTRWVRRSVGGVQLSTDGITFTVLAGLPTFGTPDTAWRAMAFNGNSIVSAYKSGANNGLLSSADGGGSFVAYTRTFSGYNTLVFLSAPYNYYLGFTGSSGRVDKTTIGMSDADWTNSFSTIATPNPIIAAAFSPTLGRLLVADALIGFLRYSDNGGVSWSDAPGFGEPVVFTRLFWLQGKFWALTSDNNFHIKIRYSSDGLTWTIAHSETTVSLAKVFHTIASF